MPSRRQVLVHAIGLGVTTGSGGCLGNFGGSSSHLAIHFEPVTRAELGMEDVVIATELEPRARRIVDDGIANGTAVYGTKPRTFVDHSVVRAGGTYYTIRAVENGSETVERPVLEAQRVDTANGPVSDWGNLSRSDALTLRCAVSTRDDDDHLCVVHEGNASAFWREPRFRYLEHGDDGYYRLSVSERSVSLDRYEYRFDPIAENESAFADYAASELVAVDFDDIDLSTNQRDVLKTASSEEVYEESPPPYSDGLLDIAERIRNARPGVDAYVRFDGSYYLARVRQSSN